MNTPPDQGHQQAVASAVA